jgi:hypothetical protein
MRGSRTARTLHCGMAMMRLGFVFAALLAGCINSDPASCTTDNPDYPDCLPEDDGKADAASAGLAQMNDLTIVMPLAKTQAQFDGYLPAKALLPKAMYTAKFPDPTGGGGAIGSDVTMRYDNLRVVAVRLDPCFANIGPVTDPSTCDNQLRIVFQSLEYSGGSTQAIDGAVHAFYRLSREQLVAAIKEIVALRKANGQTTAMGPLAPHPLIVKQGEDGAFAQGLNAILLKYASPANLIRFTHFQSSNLQTVWGFSGFDVNGSTTTPMVIPNIPNKGTSVSFFQGFASPMNGGFTPESTAKDSVTLLANASNAKAASKSAQQASYDAALRIENPGFHSPNTIDCASCHVGQAARLLIGDDVLGLSATGNPNLFVRDPKFVSARSMKQTTNVRTQPLNVHMLSYRNDQLMIGQRVINETAATVAYVNGTILH